MRLLGAKNISELGPRFVSAIPSFPPLCVLFSPLIVPVQIHTHGCKLRPCRLPGELNYGTRSPKKKTPRGSAEENNTEWAVGPYPRLFADELLCRDKTSRLAISTVSFLPPHSPVPLASSLGDQFCWQLIFAKRRGTGI